MSFQTVTMTLLDGFLLNIELFAVTLVLSLPLGLVVSFGTMSRFKPLSLLVRLYVYIMRSTPLMLQLAVVFYLPGIVFGPGHSLGRMGAASWPLCSTTRPTSPRSSAAASRVSPPASGRPGRCWA